jgi:hypothetical protein
MKQLTNKDWDNINRVLSLPINHLNTTYWEEKSKQKQLNTMKKDTGYQRWCMMFDVAYKEEHTRDGSYDLMAHQERNRLAKADGITK